MANEQKLSSLSLLIKQVAFECATDLNMVIVSSFRFIDQLGYIFKFVKDDVVDKLAILQRFVDKDNDRTLHFDTVQKAIDYETDHHLIETNPENFTRTLLRLHRALLFIIEFLRASNDRPASETSMTIANSCYDSTLSNHRK